MLRIATINDVPEMLAIYAPYVENTTVSFEYVPPTLEEFTHRFVSYTRQFPWLVWEEDGHLLGYAYASAPFTRAAYGWCAEPTVYLRPEALGKGIAAQLYAVLEEILWRQGYQVLYALVCGAIPFFPPISKILGIGIAVVLFVLFVLKAPKGQKAAK